MNTLPRVNILIATNNAILRELFHSDVQLSEDERDALKKLYLDNFNELCEIGVMLGEDKGT